MGFFSSIKRFFDSAGNTIAHDFNVVKNGFILPVERKIEGVLGTVHQDARDLVTGISNDGKSIFSGTKSTVDNIVGTSGGVLKNITTQGASTIKALGGNLEKTVSNVGQSAEIAIDKTTGNLSMPLMVGIAAVAGIYLITQKK